MFFLGATKVGIFLESSGMFNLHLVAIFKLELKISNERLYFLTCI